MSSISDSSHQASRSSTKSSAETFDLKVRQYGRFNGLGLWTLYKREVGRFIKVWLQTIVAPVVTIMLYITVFKLAFGDRGNLQGDFAGLQYNDFLAPGLISMAILQNAFQNSSSSLVQAKFNSTYVDFLMPPLSALELTIAFIGGSVTRAALVALLCGVCIHFSGLASLNIQHLWPIIWFGLTTGIVLGALGAVGGIWAEKFDHLSAIGNFVIVPLSFLSGTFYDIKVLVEPFRTLALFDPFFYFIDGFRYGFLGVANGSLTAGIWMSGGLAVLSLAAVWYMFKSGYKLKA